MMRKNIKLGSIDLSKGFTLVELLIGLVLSLFIAGIAITYFVSSSKTFRAQTSESVIQENARFGLEILSQNFRLAGMNPSSIKDGEIDILYTGKKCGTGENGLSHNASGSASCTLEGKTVTGGTPANSDRIAIQYALTQSTTGCNGFVLNVSGAYQKFASVFWVADIDDDGVRSLYCQTMDSENGQAKGNAVPLIDGVDRMQIQYGIDEDNDGVIERYQSYKNVSSKLPSIRAIRVALLISSGLGVESDTVTEEDKVRKFTLLDAPEEEFDDYKLRSIYTTTVALPNTLL